MMKCARASSDGASFRRILDPQRSARWYSTGTTLRLSSAFKHNCMQSMHDLLLCWPRYPFE
jgi:hypothetical protein